MIFWLTQSLSDVPSEDVWLAAAERHRAASFRVPKRRDDWRLGRWTAKRAVESILRREGVQIEPARIEIRATPAGIPEIWIDQSPARWALSLSHCQGLGLAALAPAGTALGCDVEAVQARSSAFLEDYFTPEERTLVDSGPADQRDARTAIVWSAKESVLKALGEGLRLPLPSARVWFDPGTPAPADPGSGWRATVVATPGARQWKGHWRCEGWCVLTLVADPPSDPPSSLAQG